jgi:hypothetical protein
MMTKLELTLLDGFLDELSDRFSSDGCNDYFLADTAETRDLIRAAYEEDYPSEPHTIRVYEGKLACNNQLILMELRRRLKLQQPSDA